MNDKEWDRRMDRALAKCGDTGILILPPGKDAAHYRAFVEGVVVATGSKGMEVMTRAVAAILEPEESEVTP